MTGLMDEENRPNPDQLLLKYGVKSSHHRGKLKVFFGYAAGVGKTYGMLRAAIEQSEAGKNVLVGYVEPHARPETMALLKNLATLPTKTIDYRGMSLEEFDLDSALLAKPELILVDELAHTNIEGSRNRKRYQDIDELLNAGIDVYTTMNVQHLESLNDIVEEITNIHVNETVPDHFFDEAFIKLIDVEPEELVYRLKEGKIYQPHNAKKAMNHFFTLENLKLLREIAIRKAADYIGMENRPDQLLNNKRVQSKLLTYIDDTSKVGAEKCIRWTARLAVAFRAEWVVLFVENDESDGKSTNEQVMKNFELAETLGAETVTLNAHDKVETIIQYAKLTGVTDIIIGKKRRGQNFRKLFKTELEDQLVQELNNVEIHMIPFAEKTNSAKPREIKNSWKPKLFSTSNFLKTILLLVVATLCSEVVTYLGIGDQNVIVVYLLFVLIIARATYGYSYGVFASILSVLLFNWFFVEPLYSLTVYKPGYPITLLIMLAVALFTSNMMIRVKSQARDSIEKEHRMEVIYDLNKDLLRVKSINGIVEITNRYLAQTLERSVIFYTEKPEQKQAYQVEVYDGNHEAQKSLVSESEIAVANWVFNNRKEAGFGSNTLMGASTYYFPLLSQGEAVAVIGVYCLNEAPLTHENLNFLKLISTQISLALERQHLANEQQEILLESEKEKMRGNLLRAISHDLRTPLTGILGASSAMIENKDKFTETLKLQLLTDIKEDSEWLIRMVENLLSVTRIDEGTMKVNKVPEAVEEIAATAVRRIRKRFPQQEIQVKVPTELILVPMDGKLIEQVLINLMENAIRHSGKITPIMVNVLRQGNDVVFEVQDQGLGIKKERLTNLFNPFDGSKVSQGAVPVDAKRGLGIGLSICKTIIAAHNGTISGENNQSKGAVFRFTLPIEPIEEENG